MANFETWGSGAKLTVRTLAPKYERCVVVVLESGLDLASLRMTTSEATKLRDDLSRAIVEAAQASAKAKTVESEGSPA